MPLAKLVAFPESRQVLVLHLFATPFLAVQWAAVAMIPVILRRDFGATKLETVIATSAIPVMMTFSIFWNEVYRRFSPRSYLLLAWLVGIVPLGGIALCHSSWTILVCVVVSALGFGAMSPLEADVLRSCYPPNVRSRVFSVIQVVRWLTSILAALGIGFWLDLDHEAFRIYLPLSVVAVGLGMILLGDVTRHRLFQERFRRTATASLWVSLRGASRNMADVLRIDRDFKTYEVGFFLYGLAWMACTALLPLLVVDKLGLDYREVAASTQVVFQVMLLCMFIPAGYLMERVGPVRVAGWTFALLTLYPIGLILARNAGELALATALYGLAMAGVQMAWMIGPVTLGKDASRASDYLAIHATLVGLRGAVGQLPAVGLFYLTGLIWIPLAVSAVLFAAGAVVMRSLDRRRVTAVEHPVEPAEAAQVPVAGAGSPAPGVDAKG